jgi:hypothetical protein
LRAYRFCPFCGLTRKRERENDITEVIDVGNTPFATQRATIATLPLTMHPQNITGTFSREMDFKATES